MATSAHRDADPSGRPLNLVYRIDRSDRICAVNEAWRKFALENDGAEIVAEKIIGADLWSCIADASTCELYRRLTARVRGGQPVQFQYRCDAPAVRRTFRMTIEARLDGEVEFASELLKSETRPAVALLDRRTPRNETFVRICSWCQLVAVDREEWVPVEEAVERLRLFEAETLPALTHGMCAACGEKFLGLLKSS